MNQKLLEGLINWPKPHLTRTEIAILLNRSSDACDAIIRRAIQAGYLNRLCRGLFQITSKINAIKPNAFEIAQFVYGPSYISFESALSWHGWIPEGVRVITSAATKPAKETTTPIGTFSYERIPVKIFSLGVSHIQLETESFLMANSWKALADLIYVRKNDWPNISHISEDLRIEREDFAESNLKLLKQLANQYPNQRTRHYLNLYYKELRTCH